MIYTALGRTGDIRHMSSWPSLGIPVGEKRMGGADIAGRKPRGFRIFGLSTSGSNTNFPDFRGVRTKALLLSERLTP